MKEENWIQEDLKEIEEERKAFLEEKDYKDFLQLGKGEHEIHFINLKQKPRTIIDAFKKKQKILRVKYKGKEHDWAINVRNPIYYKVLKLLEEGKTQARVLVSGEGASTRYEILG